MSLRKPLTAVGRVTARPAAFFSEAFRAPEGHVLRPETPEERRQRERDERELAVANFAIQFWETA